MTEVWFWRYFSSWSWFNFLPWAGLCTKFHRQVRCCILSRDKMDHSPWDCEAYGWCTGGTTQLDISLRRSETILGWNCLGFAFKSPGLVFVGPSANPTNSRPSSPFMILKSSSLIPWGSCLPRRPNCWVNSHHILWIRDPGVLPPSFSLFQRISSSFSDSCRALFERLLSEAVSLSRPVLIWRNWILYRE